MAIASAFATPSEESRQEGSRKLSRMKSARAPLQCAGCLSHAPRPVARRIRADRWSPMQSVHGDMGTITHGVPSPSHPGRLSALAWFDAAQERGPAHVAVRRTNGILLGDVLGPSSDQRLSPLLEQPRQQFGVTTCLFDGWDMVEPRILGVPHLGSTRIEDGLVDGPGGLHRGDAVVLAVQDP